MSIFDKREDSFERQFIHDRELQFKIVARRNKLLGLWAANLIGLRGEDALSYAKEVVIADLSEIGDEDVFHKIKDSLDVNGIAHSDEQISLIMAELLAEAKIQIQKEG